MITSAALCNIFSFVNAFSPPGIGKCWVHIFPNSLKARLMAHTRFLQRNFLTFWTKLIIYRSRVLFAKRRSCSRSSVLRLSSDVSPPPLFSARHSFADLDRRSTLTRWVGRARSPLVVCILQPSVKALYSPKPLFADSARFSRLIFFFVVVVAAVVGWRMVAADDEVLLLIANDDNGGNNDTVDEAAILDWAIITKW